MTIQAVSNCRQQSAPCADSPARTGPTRNAPRICNLGLRDRGPHRFQLFPARESARVLFLHGLKPLLHGGEFRGLFLVERRGGELRRELGLFLLQRPWILLGMGE